ncbi:DUF2306 domain-containing protein [Microbacterium sp.]|uniref:DUF2306 domain-containing protein n=1 Tax=Microbacterium sp. TaxID=51671 RepID=UPI002735057A|nr:DUF2306 domain-containing protein [Microbacterium sp.]MDP3950711.1 DUF2306 domain-containing protein [Microbacterium sp.]
MTTSRLSPRTPARSVSRSYSRRDALIATGLIILALIPSAAGAFRVSEIATGAPTTPENARFMEMPLPVVLHIVGALVYSGIGAFQFLPGLRSRHIGWHRFSGRYLLVPAGTIVALSGLWMTAFYDVPPIDGTALQVSRYVVGTLMLAFLVLGVLAVLRRDISAHRGWMIRAYALAMGAGTQVLTSAPFAILFGAPDEFWRVVQMDAGWLINIVVAELIIRRGRRPAEMGA